MLWGEGTVANIRWGGARLRDILIAAKVAQHNVPAGQPNMRPGMHPGYMTNEQQQQMAYYQNLQQQHQAGGQYPMPVGNRMPNQHQPTA